MKGGLEKEAMLGRKQSLKGEQVLADYGPEESLNESADIEWVNKVSHKSNIASGAFSPFRLRAHTLTLETCIRSSYGSDD